MKARDADAILERQEFQLAPFYGRTYSDINTAPSQRISDHAPSTLDLPLMEPQSAVSRTQ